GVGIRVANLRTVLRLAMDGQLGQCEAEAAERYTTATGGAGPGERGDLAGRWCRPGLLAPRSSPPRRTSRSSGQDDSTSAASLSSAMRVPSSLSAAETPSGTPSC